MPNALQELHKRSYYYGVSMVIRGLSIELIKEKGGKRDEGRGKEGLKRKGVAHGLPISP